MLLKTLTLRARGNLNATSVSIRFRARAYSRPIRRRSRISHASYGRFSRYSQSGGAHATQLDALSKCIVESDLESTTRANWLRGKSLAISLALQCGVLAALLLMPLLAPSALPPVYVVTPAPPYSGQHGRVHKVAPPKSTRSTSIVFHPVADRPTVRPPEQVASTEPPMIADDIGAPFGAVGPQFGIPSGENHGTSIHIAPLPSGQRTKPLPQSEGVMAARLVSRIQPDYPRIAQLMRLSGIVRLRAIIGTDGSVRQLEVLSGNTILAQAAAAAVSQWRYEPTRLNGQPVEVETSITVTFVLN